MSSQFTKYKRTQIAEMRPYIPGENLDHVSISLPDRKAGSPKIGDMIARNPKNYEDQWLVAAEYFSENFDPVDPLMAVLDLTLLGNVVLEVATEKTNPTIMDVAKAYQAKRLKAI